MILAIETATEICGVALYNAQVTLAFQIVNEKNIHSEKLMSLIDDVLREASISTKQLDGIAISSGPGSFTGLRIGLSVAKGLAFALDIPLIPVPTLDGIAEEYFRTHSSIPSTIICPLIDAKRDEAYFALYSVLADGVSLISEYGIQSVKEIVSITLQYHSVVFVGDGAKKIAPFIHSENQNIISSVICNPVAVAQRAEQCRQELQLKEFSHFEPLYVREFFTTLPK